MVIIGYDTRRCRVAIVSARVLTPIVAFRVHCIVWQKNIVLSHYPLYKYFFGCENPSTLRCVQELPNLWK